MPEPGGVATRADAGTAGLTGSPSTGMLTPEPEVRGSAADSASQPTQRATLAYEPALDGLRAVAVLAVMLFHGGVAVVSGGFLGVDIFFVLSGFLITSLLLAEQQRNGSIGLRAFWGRRARRLLPALFLVLAAVLAVAVLAGTDPSGTLRGDSVATLLYVSNWWFVLKGQNYFDAFTDPSPLTHTWSLAIEEQWYLLLPLALIVLLPRISRKALLACFAMAALVSATVMACLYFAHASQGRIYYGTDTRVQALLVGAALAVVFTGGGLERISRAAKWISLLAGAGVLAVIALANESSGWLYLGGFLLFACLSAALLAAVVADPASVAARALGSRPMVAIGRISYGLYLWHWPVYVWLSPTRTQLGGMALLALRVGVTFAVSTASYWLVERPIRRGALRQLSASARIGVGVAVPVALLALLVAVTPSANASGDDSLEQIAAEAQAPVPAPKPDPAVPAKSRKVSAIVVGDSNALSLVHYFKPSMTRRLTVLHGTNFGCGVIPYAAVVDGQKLDPLLPCRQWRRGGRANWISATGAQVGVLMGGSWEQYDRWVDGKSVPYDSKQWHDMTVEDYSAVLQELHATSERVAVITNSCHRVADPGLPVATMFRAGRVPQVVNDPKRIAATNKALMAAAQRMTFPVQVIDLNAYLCADGYSADWKGETLRTDGLHFSSAGADRIWPWLGPQLRDGSGATPGAPAVMVGGDG